MLNLPPLLADWEWVQGLVPLLIAGLLGLRQYLESRSAGPARDTEPAELEPIEPQLDEQAEFQRQAQVERKAGFEPQPTGPRAAAGRRRGAASVDSDVDDFLRRLNDQRRAEDQQRPPLRSEPQGAPPKPQPTADRPDRRAPAQPTPAAAEPERRRTPRPTDRRAPAESVAEHVRTHVDRLAESQLAENAAKMASDIAGRDDRLADRMRTKFDHKLGALGSGDQTTGSGRVEESESPTAAENIAALLAKPEGIRNAILLNEILRPPTDRF